MARRYSNVVTGSYTTVTVSDPSIGLPFWPAPGEQRVVSKNTFFDVANDRTYTDKMSGAQGVWTVLTAYNCGCYNPYLGVRGALVVQGGGHGAYEGPEPYWFSLDDFQWHAEPVKRFWYGVIKDKEAANYSLAVDGISPGGHPAWLSLDPNVNWDVWDTLTPSTLNAPPTVINGVYQSGFGDPADWYPRQGYIIDSGATNWGERKPQDGVSVLPITAHNYNNMVTIPPQWGGGPFGSFAHAGRLIVGRDSQNVRGCHRYDFSQRKYLRYSYIPKASNGIPALTFHYCEAAVFDPVRGEITFIPKDVLTDVGTGYAIYGHKCNVDGTAQWNMAIAPRSAPHTTLKYATGCYWPPGDKILFIGKDTITAGNVQASVAVGSAARSTFYSGDRNSMSLMGIDPANKVGGILRLNLSSSDPDLDPFVTGSLAGWLGGGGRAEIGFTWCDDGGFFIIKGFYPGRFVKLTPPVPANWATGNWVLEKFPDATLTHKDIEQCQSAIDATISGGVTVDGTTVSYSASFTNDYPGAADGFGNRFSYVPSLKSCVWTWSWRAPVYAWRVPGI